MKKSILIFATALFALGLTSCGSPDFTQVKEGMSKEEVTKLVGEPNSSLTIMGKTELTYKGHSVKLVDDKVTEVISK